MLSGISLNDGAKRNRLPYLKIMYTAIRKILYLPKFFAFFSIKIDSLTLKVMTTPYFAQFFAFLALKLIHLLPPILPKFFALFSIRIDSLTLKVMTTPYHSAV